MRRLNRVFYIGMITTDIYADAIGVQTYSGAAARKMTSVGRAMRSVGLRAVLVSLPFVGRDAERATYPAVVTSDRRLPSVFLPTLRSKYLRKLAGPWILAAFAARRITRSDTVILYNHALEYIPALVVLRLRGVRVVQDVEDAPTADEGGLRGFFNQVCFAATFTLTAHRKMVVAEHVARQLGLEDYVVIRGVASNGPGLSGVLDVEKWCALRGGGELRVHYGGTLIADTGVDLFCEAVELLARGEERLHRPVVFKATGVGEIAKIQRLQARVQGSRRVRVELLPELSSADYAAVIGACHCSLSLKRPGSGISKTTFPSKVIEIVAAGLALVSTRLGDVTSLFGDGRAFLLAQYEPAALVDVIVEMAQDPGRVEQVARAGREFGDRTFSASSVGEAMKALV